MPIYNASIGEVLAWGLRVSLAGQSNLLGKLQASEKICLKKKIKVNSGYHLSKNS